MAFPTLGIIVIVLLLLFLLSQAIKIVFEYERGVIFRLGRLVGVKGPGIFFIIPLVDRMVKVDLRTITMDIPSQEVITKDNVPIKVDAVIYFRIIDPAKALTQVENYIVATSMLGQTTLRSVLGQSELDEILTEREKLNKTLQEIIDQHTAAWGIKVTAVEIKNVELPEGMKRAMARQAEAERERRAKIIAAEGELQAAEKLRTAAEIISKTPAAIQLRFLQTVTEAATEKASTIVVPVPIDLIRIFLDQRREEISDVLKNLLEYLKSNK